MRIGINAISSDLFGGGNTFITNLISNLAIIDKENSYYIFTSRENRSHFFIDQSNFSFINLYVSKNNMLGRLFYEHVVIPFQSKMCCLDLYYSPTDILPYFLRGIKSILTFQNNIFYNKEWRNSLPKVRYWYMKCLVRRSLTRAKKIIAVSSGAKEDLLQYYPGLESRLEVVHEAVDPAFCLPKVGDNEKWFKLKHRFGFEGNYILFVSNIFPHKNADKLLDVFHQFKKYANYNGGLIFIGIPMDRKCYKRLKKLVELYGLNKDVIFIDFVSKNELRLFYSFADVLVYPSSCETFGLPPLEAMACGCPVITSNQKATIEIVADAALIVDPNDKSALGDAIGKVVNNPALRETLIRRGLERVKQFSWNKAAKETLKIFREVDLTAKI